MFASSPMKTPWTNIGEREKKNSGLIHNLIILNSEMLTLISVITYYY